MPCTIDPVRETVAWLSSRPELDAPVSTTVPADATPPYITVRRTGGQLDPLHDMPLMTVHCWERSDAEAMRMGRLTADMLRRMACEHPAIHRMDVLSLYTDRDPDTGLWYAELNLQAGLAPTLPELY